MGSEMCIRDSCIMLCSTTEQYSTLLTVRFSWYSLTALCCTVQFVLYCTVCYVLYQLCTVLGTVCSVLYCLSLYYTGSLLYCTGYRLYCTLLFDSPDRPPPPTVPVPDLLPLNQTRLQYLGTKSRDIVRPAEQDLHQFPSQCFPRFL